MKFLLLNIGETFFYGREKYIKKEEFTVYYDDSYGGTRYNAVNLRDGSFKQFLDNDKIVI